jgi:hypothetical protein
MKQKRVFWLPASCERSSNQRVADLAPRAFNVFFYSKRARGCIVKEREAARKPRGVVRVESREHAALFYSAPAPGDNFAKKNEMRARERA